MKEKWQGISASTVGHLTDEGYLKGIRSQVANQRLVGHITTVRVHLPNAVILREALIRAQPGEVLAIECVGNREYACWGELRNLAAQIKGLAGVIIGGKVTDIRALREQDFAVFAEGISALTTRRTGDGAEGELNVPIQLSGMTLKPGDFAIGDEDGIFVLNSDKANQLLSLARSKENSDQQKKEAFLLQLSKS